MSRVLALVYIFGTEDVHIEFGRQIDFGSCPYQFEDLLSLTSHAVQNLYHVMCHQQLAFCSVSDSFPAMFVYNI